jgi:hypothetical protein
MKILIDIGHPAHVHYFRNFIKIMESKGHKFIVTTRDKECTIKLLEFYKINYICTGKSRKSVVGKMLSLLQNDLKIFLVALKHNPDIFLSFFLPFPAHVGWILKKPVIGFTDTEHAALSIKLTKRFTDVILTPSCYTKDLGKKQIRFNGYMELCYLHPNYFKPNPSILNLLGVRENEKYVIMRFVSWNASHDVGHSGLSIEMKHKAVKELSKYAKVFISSEGELPKDLKQYQIKIPPEKMHDALAFATLFVGESGTMASECVMLGTPAFFINTLTAGTLEMQEESGLLFMFTKFEGVLEKAVELLNTPNLKQEFQNRRQKMLADKIDVTAFMVWFVENFPESFKIMKENPDEIGKRFHGVNPSETQKNFL